MTTADGISDYLTSLPPWANVIVLLGFFALIGFLNWLWKD